MGDILLITFVFLIAGVLAVPVATRFGLGSVLGYLIAGIAISPLLSAFGVDVVSIQHFAEFGVVMMLFLVGLELEPRLLWSMRARLLGLGGLQVVLTTAVVMGVALALGQVWTVALTIGLVLALSSTAIVLQTLNEKGLMKSDGGQGGFSVLLFQDIAVIPMLAFIPLLAMPELQDMSHAATGHEGDGHGHGLNLVEGLAGWQRALVTVAGIAIVIVIGSRLTGPMFRFVSLANMREIFVAAALLWVVGIALLMTLIGLSPALGTFIAGVVLANSEYRHELESDIDPFKGLLLGLFFITVGAGIDFGLLSESPGMIVGLAIGLMVVKAVILLGLSFLFRIRGSDRWLLALGLAQAGEFGFVLLSFSVAQSVMPEALADQLLLVVAISMLLTPALFILHDRVIAHRFIDTASDSPDPIDEIGPIIVAGHGRFGGVVNRMLRESGYTTTVLDYSSAQLEMLRAFGLGVYYGDATRPDLLHAAGIEKAAMIVIAIDGRDRITELVRHVRKNHPQVHVVARAVDRTHVYELWSAGARDVIRETFDSAVRAGRSALEALGEHPFDAERKARQYVVNDRKHLRALADLYVPNVPLHENPAFIEKTHEVRAEIEAALTGEDRGFAIRAERGWSPPSVNDVETEKRRSEEPE
ncbi:MAG: cation:proton antiporter [Minwuia sp.]|uniref:cation:proton antiporter domain-containing protein n=1 Tax=Minwuia sp. TaxID=2493630 RepID=UPI003A865A8F